MAEQDPDRWKPRMLPPEWLVLGIATCWALDRWLPVAHVVPEPARWSALAPWIAGPLLAAWGAWEFRRARTGLVPGSDVTAFVRNGPFRVTRNPMYVGMALVLLGTAIWFGSVTPFLVVPAFVAIIQRRFIRREEAILRREFGAAAWQEYAAATRRWI